MAERAPDYDRLMRSDVFDRDGEKIGRVIELYAEEADGPPRWGLIGTGFLRARMTFVPLDRYEFREDSVILPYTKKEIEGAPLIEADRSLGADEEEALFAYYAPLGYKRSSTHSRLRQFLLGP